jgi:hypothetical protein
VALRIHYIVSLFLLEPYLVTVSHKSHTVKHNRFFSIKGSPMSVLHRYTSTVANANSHPSPNMGWTRQFVVSIVHHYTGEWVSCSPVGVSLIDLLILTRSYLYFSIHTLTRSRAQTALVLALSTLAFTFGLVNIVGAWAHPS